MSTGTGLGSIRTRLKRSLVLHRRMGYRRHTENPSVSHPRRFRRGRTRETPEMVTSVRVRPAAGEEVRSCVGEGEGRPHRAAEDERRQPCVRGSPCDSEGSAGEHRAVDRREIVERGVGTTMEMKQGGSLTSEEGSGQSHCVTGPHLERLLSGSGNWLEGPHSCGPIFSLRSDPTRIPVEWLRS